MEIVYDQDELEAYMREAVEVSEDSPILLDRFLDQAIEVDIDGGVGPYSFLWNGPGGFTSTSPNVFNIPTGNYTIFVTDNNGCVYESTFNVTTPNPILINESIDSNCKTSL